MHFNTKPGPASCCATVITQLIHEKRWLIKVGVAYSKKMSAHFTFKFLIYLKKVFNWNIVLDILYWASEVSEDVLILYMSSSPAHPSQRLFRCARNFLMTLQTLKKITINHMYHVSHSTSTKVWKPLLPHRIQKSLNLCFSNYWYAKSIHIDLSTDSDKYWHSLCVLTCEAVVPN